MRDKKLESELISLFNSCENLEGFLGFTTDTKLYHALLIDKTKRDYNVLIKDLFVNNIKPTWVILKTESPVLQEVVDKIREAIKTYKVSCEQK